MALRLILADPQPFFRHVLTTALRLEDDLDPVGSTDDEEEAIALARQASADLIISEIELGRGSGLHLASRVKGETPVLILTRRSEGEVILDAAASGAVGCVGHSAGLSSLKALVRRTLDGVFCVDATRLREILIDAGRSKIGEDAEAIQSLTVREREVLFRLATGADDDSIARSLYISPHTVRTHVGNVLRKLGVHSRSEAARLALAAGLHSDNIAEAIQIEGPGWSR
jgi:two-component system NarL family response regulator